jgi:hypothetical protein
VLLQRDGFWGAGLRKFALEDWEERRLSDLSYRIAVFPDEYSKTSWVQGVFLELFGGISRQSEADFDPEIGRFPNLVTFGS